MLGKNKMKALIESTLKTHPHHPCFFILFSPLVVFFNFKKRKIAIIDILALQAPCFVFVDEIDAIAGRHARKDPRRKATFEALIAQLEGE